MASKLCCFRGWLTQKGEYNVQNIEASSANVRHHVASPDHPDLVGALAEIARQSTTKQPSNAATDQTLGGEGRIDISHPKQVLGRCLWSDAVTPNSDSTETQARESLIVIPTQRIQPQNDEEMFARDAEIVKSPPSNLTSKLEDIASASVSSTQRKTVTISTAMTSSPAVENSNDNQVQCQDTSSSSASVPTPPALEEQATLEENVHSSDPDEKQDPGSTHSDQKNYGDNEYGLAEGNELDEVAVSEEDREQDGQLQQNEDDDEDDDDDDVTDSLHSEIEMEEDDDQESDSDSERSSGSRSEQILLQEDLGPETQPSLQAEEEDQERPRRLRLYERQSLRRLGEQFVQGVQLPPNGSDFEGLSEAERQEEWSRYLERTRQNLVHELQRRIRQQPQARRQNYVYRVVSILESTVSRNRRQQDDTARSDVPDPPFGTSSGSLIRRVSHPRQHTTRWRRRCNNQFE